MFEQGLEVLEALREPLAAEEQKLKARLDEIRKQRQALDKAISALSPKAKAKPKAKAPSPADWIPSQKILDAVLATVQREGESSVNEVAKVSGTAPDTARRALTVLRERELVRLSSARGRRGAALYAPMPNGDTP